MMFPKPKREKDEKYLEWVRSQKCLVKTCNKQAEAAHFHSRGAGGSDYSARPLCRIHHIEEHTIGKHTFNKKYRLGEG